MGYIYAITNQQDYSNTDDLTEIGYIGRTENSPIIRLRCHISEAKKGGKSKKCVWIRNILSTGHIPDIIILEECDNSELVTKEKLWINDLKQCYSLSNSIEPANNLLTDEGRKKLSDAARKARIKQLQNNETLSFHKPEVRKNISLKGFKHSKTSKHNMSIGAKKRFSNLKEREKISKATKGLSKTKEHKQKLSEASKKQYNAQPNVSCDICGYIGKPGVVGMHKKNKHGV